MLDRVTVSEVSILVRGQIILSEGAIWKKNKSQNFSYQLHKKSIHFQK